MTAHREDIYSMRTRREDLYSMRTRREDLYSMTAHKISTQSETRLVDDNKMSSLDLRSSPTIYQVSQRARTFHIHGKDGDKREKQKFGK